MKKILQLAYIQLSIVVLDTCETLKSLSSRQKRKVLETLFFGLLVNSLYGMTDALNLKDVLLALVSIYVIIRTNKRS